MGTDSAPTTRPAATTQLPTYKCRGQLVTARILVKGGQSPRIKVDHEAIPNFMPAMRMDFPVAEQQKSRDW